MNFILQAQPLPINCNKVAQGYQYYEWYYKQKLQKQHDKQNNLKQMLKSIEQQQRINLKAKKKTNSKYNINHPTGRDNRKHHSGTFYEYNMIWKNNIDKKIECEKNHIKYMQAQCELQMARNRNIPISSNNNQYQLATQQHRGPILAWSQHFDAYLKNKSQAMTSKNEDITFQPKINNKSKKMTEGITQKVQQRLIRYGEAIKIKHQQQQMSQYSDFKLRPSLSQPQNFSTDLFQRLYRQGELANKRKRLEQQSSVSSFQPKINKISERMQSRIMQRRKPLYYVKTGLSFSSSQINSHQEDTISTKKKGNFQSFMQRNQALINLKKKMAAAYEEEKQQKQTLERSQCTFNPIMNKNSRRIIRHFENQMNMHESAINDKLNTHKLQMHKIEPDTSRIQIDGQQISVLNKQPSYEEGDSLSGYYIHTDPNSSSSQSKDEIKTKRLSVYHGKHRQTVNQMSVQQQSVQQSVQILDMKSSSRNVVTTETYELSCSRQNVKSGLKQTKQQQYEDSIEMGKQQQQSHDRRWQAQLMQIEQHLENMMSRATT